MNKISIKQIISESFQQYRENFLSWFLVSFLITSPSIVYDMDMLHGQGAFASSLFLLLFTLVSIWGGILLIILISAKTSSEEMLLNKAAAIACGRFIGVIGVTVISGLILINGYLLFVVPGIYLTVLLLFNELAVVIDGLSPLNALRASRSYVRGHWWTVFFIVFIIFLFYGPLFFLDKFFHDRVLMETVRLIISAFILPLTITINILLYRKLKAGRDFQPIAGSRLKAVGMVLVLQVSMIVLLILWGVAFSIVFGKHLKHTAIKHELNGTSSLYTAWSRSIEQTSKFMDGNQHVQAAQTCQSALDLAGKVFDRNEIRFIMNENLCGQAYLATGQYDRAQELLLASLNSIEMTAGKDSVGTVEPLNDLARLYIVTNQKEKAEKTLQRVLGVYEKSNRGDYHKVLNDWKESKKALLESLAADGTKGAPALLREPVLQELALSTEVNRQWSHEQAKTFNRLRQFYQDNGRLAEAEVPAQRAIEIFQELYGPDHEFVENVSMELAKIYRLQGKWQAAVETYEKILNISIRKHGPTSFKTRSILESLLAVYTEMGDRSKIDEYRRKIDEIKRQI